MIFEDFPQKESKEEKISYYELGSKGILTPMIHGLLRISCSRNPKNIRNSPCSGYFLMFYGSQSHAFSCKHETHNLLPLVSYYILKKIDIYEKVIRN